MWRIGDLIGVGFVVAIVYVLVRPQSKAGQLVEAVANLMTALIGRATDLANPQA